MSRGNRSPGRLKRVGKIQNLNLGLELCQTPNPGNGRVSDHSVLQGLSILTFYCIFITFALLSSCPALEHTQLLALRLILSKAFLGGGKRDGCWNI